MIKKILKMALLLTMILIISVVLYFKKYNANYSLCMVIKYEHKYDNKFLRAAILFNQMPSEFDFDLIMKQDSTYKYLKNYLFSLDFTNKSYIITNRREIISIYWSPRLGDEYYNLFNFKHLPVYVKFGNRISNNFYIYSLKKDKYRISQKMDFQ